MHKDNNTQTQLIHATTYLKQQQKQTRIKNSYNTRNTQNNIITFRSTCTRQSTHLHNSCKKTQHVGKPTMRNTIQHTTIQIKHETYTHHTHIIYKPLHASCNQQHLQNRKTYIHKSHNTHNYTSVSYTVR